jgi:SHAQKYF class myb-like DNA-binding protein
MTRGRWTDHEHQRFLTGMKLHGRSWKTIAETVVKTRTPEQVRIHAQKYFQKQEKLRGAQLGVKGGECFPLPVTNARLLPAAPRRWVLRSLFRCAADTKEGPWTDEEHELFLKCWHKYGKAWKKLSEIMKTRTNEQIRTHAQKYFQKLRELR